MQQHRLNIDQQPSFMQQHRSNNHRIGQIYAVTAPRRARRSVSNWLYFRQKIIAN